MYFKLLKKKYKNSRGILIKEKRWPPFDLSRLRLHRTRQHNFEGCTVSLARFKIKKITLNYQHLT